jgi:Co/Zn/Cd efflux system component
VAAEEISSDTGSTHPVADRKKPIFLSLGALGFARRRAHRDAAISTHRAKIIGAYAGSLLIHLVHRRAPAWLMFY